MRIYRKVVAVMALSCVCLAASTAFGEGVGATKKHRKHPAAAQAQAQRCEACEAIEQLKEQIRAQQAEIDQLKAAQAAQQAPPPPTADEEARAAAAAAQKSANDAAAAAAAAQASANSANTTAGQAQQTATTANTSAEEAQKRVGELETPPYIHFKNVRLTPGGFLTLDTIFRQRAENTDVISSFAGIPYASSPFSRMTEFRESARQSRLSLLAQGTFKNVNLTGFVELDFLSAAPTANEVQTSSFNLRQRQLFGEASWNSGWSITGGQTWSLLTTNTKGTETRREWVPMVIDPGYLVGYTYARLAGFRVAKTFGEGKSTVAFAMENPATVVFPAGSGGVVSAAQTGGPTVVFGGPGTVTDANGNVFSTNVAPDLIAKLAFDPSFGHFEIKGVGRFFRDRIPGFGNTTTMGWGVGAAAIVPIANKKANVILEAMAGRGIGRYGDSLTTDVTFNPGDGSLSPIKNLRGAGGFEVHVTPKLDWYVYGGDEYLGRNFYATGTGYGNPNVFLGNGNDVDCAGPDVVPVPTCGANIRNLVQGISGFWYTMYKGGYGMLRYGMQYSWTYKTTWQDASGFAPKASDNMAFGSFRYYLP